MAMAHPDREARIGAHSVFSIVLMPSLFSPWLDQKAKMVGKVESESFSIQDRNFGSAEPMQRELLEENTRACVNGKYAANLFRVYSFTHALTDGKDV